MDSSAQVEQSAPIGAGQVDVVAREANVESRAVRAYLFEHRTVELIVLIMLVTVGALWSEAAQEGLRQYVFRAKEPSALQWGAAAAVASVIFLVGLGILTRPSRVFP
nr:hypothetical protein [Pandoravirus massiliensis]